jgi:hypothetical protein
MRLLPFALALLLAAPAPAWAGPGLLPPGSASVYGGTGLSVWTWGMSGNPRDPAGIFRVDTWGGAGIAPHLMVSGGVPLVHSNILVDEDGVAPCPNRDADYCRPVTSLGDAHVLVHAGTRVKGVDVRAAVGPRSDAWNAGTRTRYVNVGQGTWGGMAELSAGAEGSDVGAFLEGRYVLRFGRAVDGLDLRAPGDAIQGQAAVVVTPGRLRLQASALGHRQLRGIDYGPEYLRAYYPTDERWGVVAFAQLRAEAKVSVALSDRSGLHVAASRAVHTVNGPRDHTDVSIGMHLWMPGD